MMAVMGIDPGVSGGLAVVNSRGDVHHVEGFTPGMTQAALIEAVRLGLYRLHALGEGVHIFIETVQYIGKRDDGRKGDGGQGAFTFGRVDGLLRGAVLMWIAENSVGQLHEATPMFWQAALECLTRGNKNVTKRKAAELWPRERWTHATADAALIAEYGRRRLML
jgi:hypothetical protein